MQAASSDAPHKMSDNIHSAKADDRLMALVVAKASQVFPTPAGPPPVAKVGDLYRRDPRAGL